MSWRCQVGEWPVLNWLWPLIGHRIHFADGWAYCDRCAWRKVLFWPESPGVPHG